MASILAGGSAALISGLAALVLFRVAAQVATLLRVFLVRLDRRCELSDLAGSGLNRFP